MKLIKNLKGIKTLSKTEQSSIKGSLANRVYCNGPHQCCVRWPNGQEFCDYGYCQSNGNCMWA
ncbi:hypothetical protein ACE939_07470 [Aquimarina sp. W85]|uniref:hypothetical protein n=1 Tax=Aquimarina rhodophyticola TaxID=3342246 RepID=UPI003671F2E0